MSHTVIALSKVVFACVNVNSKGGRQRSQGQAGLYCPSKRKPILMDKIFDCTRQ